MSPHAIRPEDRSRATSTGADSADTTPACFRSEGFAEDLHDAQAVDPARVLQAGRRRPGLKAAAMAWRGTLPGLGLVLSGLLGPFGR